MSFASVQNLTPETLALLRRHNLLRALIKAEILSETVKGIELSEEQRDSAWNSFVAEKKLNDPSSVETYLKNNGLNENDLRWQLELPERIQIHEQNFNTNQKPGSCREEQLDRVVYSLLRLKMLAGSGALSAHFGW